MALPLVDVQDTLETVAQGSHPDFLDKAGPDPLDPPRRDGHAVAYGRASTSQQDAGLKVQLCDLRAARCHRAPSKKASASPGDARSCRAEPERQGRANHRARALAPPMRCSPSRRRCCSRVVAFTRHRPSSERLRRIPVATSPTGTSAKPPTISEMPLAFASRPWRASSQGRRLGMPWPSAHRRRRTRRR